MQRTLAPRGIAASLDLDETMLWLRLASAHVPYGRGNSVNERVGNSNPMRARSKDVGWAERDTYMWSAVGRVRLGQPYIASMTPSTK
jgi:hypothetical protein